MANPSSKVLVLNASIGKNITATSTPGFDAQCFSAFRMLVFVAVSAAAISKGISSHEPSVFFFR